MGCGKLPCLTNFSSQRKYSDNDSVCTFKYKLQQKVSPHYCIPDSDSISYSTMEATVYHGTPICHQLTPGLTKPHQKNNTDLYIQPPPLDPWRTKRPQLSYRKHTVLTTTTQQAITPYIHYPILCLSLYNCFS